MLSVQLKQLLNLQEGKMSLFDKHLSHLLLLLFNHEADLTHDGCGSSCCMLFAYITTNHSVWTQYVLWLVNTTSLVNTTHHLLHCSEGWIVFQITHMLLPEYQDWWACIINCMEK